MQSALQVFHKHQDLAHEQSHLMGLFQALNLQQIAVSWHQQLATCFTSACVVQLLQRNVIKVKHRPASNQSMAGAGSQGAFCDHLKQPDIEPDPQIGNAQQGVGV